MTNDQLIALAHEEVTASLPLTRGATVVRGTVVREKRATFSLAPGQPPRPGAETPVRGFYLAGDWTDTGLPATIEGAVESGHRAAGLITGSAPGTSHAAPGTRHVAPAHQHSAPICTLHGQVHEVRHRPLPGAGAQGPQPPVVRGPPEAQPESGHRRTGHLARPHADGPDRDRARPRSALGGCRLAARDRVRRRQLLLGRPRLLRPRRAGRGHPRRPRRSHAGLVQGGGATVGQAVSDPVAGDREGRWARASRAIVAGPSTSARPS